MGWPTWREATEAALYGPDGFYRRERPADHFVTSVHTSPWFAGAIVSLARLCDATTVVDLGAGEGELLCEVRRRSSDLRLVGIDITARPPGIDNSIEWTSNAGADLLDVLVVANEWLDDIPVDVVEVDDDGIPRLVHVDPMSGAEQLGEIPDGDDAQWLARWWPLDGAEPGTRAEIGRARDQAWVNEVRRVRRGLLVAVDYSHRRADRPPLGTLTGYRAGRMVEPVPDGSCNVTSHVALDACAVAGIGAGAAGTVLTTQRQALLALGVDGTRPPVALASSDPPAYLTALARAAQAAEILDPAGLGGFGWLVQAVGRPVPDALADLGH